MNALLDLRNIVYRRQPERSGDDVAAPFELSVPRFRLDKGGCVAIAGPSGSGKSSFLDIVALLRAPAQASKFELAGVDAAALWSGRQLEARVGLRASNIGYVLQTGGLLPYLSVEENILLSQRLLGKVDAAWVDELLNSLGIALLRTRLPSALSLGERQRVAIARALAHRPALVLADEPTASLDAENAERVFTLLVSLCTTHHTGLIIVSHDRELTRRHRIEEVECERSGHQAVISR